jgi:hypothetical protein
MMVGAMGVGGEYKAELPGVLCWTMYLRRVKHDGVMADREQSRSSNVEREQIH